MSTVFFLSKEKKEIDLVCTSITKSGNSCIHFETVDQLNNNLRYFKPEIILLDGSNFSEEIKILLDKIEPRDSKIMILDYTGDSKRINKEKVNLITDIKEFVNYLNSYNSKRYSVFEKGENKIFDLFFDHLPEPASITKLEDGNFVRVNKKFVEVSGFQPNEIINQSSVNKLLWVKKGSREKYIHRLKKEHHIQAYKTYFHNKHKEIVSCYISSTLFSDNGQDYVLSILDNNITNKILEEKLFETQSIARVGSYTLDFRSGMWSSSKILDDIFEITENYDRSIDGWLNIVHPKWRDTMKTYLQENVIQNKEEFDRQYQITTIKDKTDKWVHGRGSLVYRNGELVKMIGTIIDISEYKKIEKKLKGKQALLDKIINTSPVGILLTDKQGNIYYANKRSEQILNLSISRDNTIKYNAPEWRITDLNGEDYPEDKLPFILVKNHLQPVYGIKHAIENQDHSRKFLSINASPIIDEYNEFNGMIATIEDITPQIEFENKIQVQNKQLEELISVKDRLFSILGHDLRSPIGNITQLSNFLNIEFSSLDHNDIREILSSLEHISEQALILIENILEWSRIERCLIQPVFNTICIDDLFNHAINLHKSLAKHKRIRIIKEVELDECILCDIDMTKTVLRNLISNAIKFTPPEKYIKLSVHKFNDSYLEISIQDQGPGIPVHMLADLFKYSFNKPKIMNHKEAGTGLGLPICKEFIELQGGKIYVKENTENGVTIAFKLKI